MNDLRRISPPRICFIVALLPEARPLISHFRLERQTGRLRTYRGDGMALVLSGVGKVASAAATAYVFAKLGERRGAIWLNVGIAGHRERPYGQPVLARTIVDRATGRTWRLRPPALQWETDDVVTVDRMEEAFETPGVYEMEAAGFYPTAIRFTPRERVQCLKIISDNRKLSPRLLDARRVESLIEAGMEAIATLVDAELRLAREPGNGHRERR